MSWSTMLPRAMSGFVVLMELGIMLVSVAHVTTSGHADVNSLCQCLKPRWFPWAVLAHRAILMLVVHLRPCWSPWTWLLPGSMLGSMLVSIVHGLCCPGVHVDGLRCLQGL